MPTAEAVLYVLGRISVALAIQVLGTLFKLIVLLAKNGRFERGKGLLE